MGNTGSKLNSDANWRVLSSNEVARLLGRQNWDDSNVLYKSLPRGLQLQLVTSFDVFELHEELREFGARGSLVAQVP